MTLGTTPVATLADRLFSAASEPRAFPFWADGGGAGLDATRYNPGRHVLAAYPSEVEQVSVASMAPGALIPWLRSRLPVLGASEDKAPLTVVLLSYDAGRNLEQVPATARVDPPLPDVIVARYPAFLIGDSETGPWRMESVDAPAATRLLRALLASNAADDVAEAGVGRPGPLQSSMTEGEHAYAVNDILSHIAAGDLYQANVARRLEATMDSAFSPTLYAAMRARNPAAFGALWRWGDDGWLASSSPECLFTVDAASRSLHSYPIKGTRPRGTTDTADAAMQTDLFDDLKERAEHVMIVDLVRNDLGRVAEIGSVHVPRLFDIMTLPTVHHMVSDVAATLALAHDLADAIAALFPGGSVTGAPKIAAMAAIERVESLRRGFYTGSLGLVFGNGDAVFNILIRTCVAVEGRLLYQTGGGIVADSTPANEWRETSAKARALLGALEALGRS